MERYTGSVGTNTGLSVDTVATNKHFQLNINRNLHGTLDFSGCSFDKKFMFWCLTTFTHPKPHSSVTALL